jgi:hypothetical protein
MWHRNANDVFVNLTLPLMFATPGGKQKGFTLRQEGRQQKNLAFDAHSNKQMANRS